MAGNKNSGRKRKSIAEKKLTGTYKKNISKGKDLIQEQAEKIMLENAPTRIDKDTKIEVPPEITNNEVIQWFNSYTENARCNGYLLPQDLATLHLAAWNLQKLFETVARINELEKADPTNGAIETLYRRVTRLQNLFDKNGVKLSVSQPDRLKLISDAIDVNRKQFENKSLIDRMIEGD